MDYYGLLFLYYLKGLSGKSVLRLFFNIEAGGTEQLLPENTSTPTTTPILADIQYPDGLRTDQYFTYRETPTTVSNKARIKTIKGNTLVWNQLVPVDETSKSTTVAGVTITDNRDGSYTFTGTATETQYLWLYNRQAIPSFIKPNHRYLIRSMTSDPAKIRVQFILYGDTPFIREETGGNILTTPSDFSSYTDFGLVIVFINGSTFTNEKLYPVLIDLTEMGLDISNPSEFTSLFPLSYYSYNQGSLLSFNGNGIKTTGKNLLKTNISSETINGVTFTVNKDENGELTEIIVSGTATQRANLHVLPQGTNNVLSTGRYILSCGFGSDNIYMSSYNTTTGLSYRDFGSGAEVPYVAGEDYSIYISVLAGATANNIIFKPMLRLIDVEDSTFEPYTSSTLSLPITTYFPSGMKSAGSVYDELTDSKAITRIGAVDLGTLSWNWQPTWQAWYTYQMSESLKGASNNDTKPNIVSANYPTLALNNILGTSTFGISTSNVSTSNKLIAVENGSDTVTPTGYLYYELATPTETPITTEDANEALSLLMGKSVSSSNANQMINIITKGE